MTDFAKTSLSRASADFNKIPKLVKGGVLMIIHIYAKVSLNKKSTYQLISADY
ncbi:hypothetical protein SPONN_1533 [uncultured Candidatus Thioglobus sp.]|nr:hypothetical protein SPONN_1533 [uncultured Candidatus Thioglobus sp.]